MADWINEHGVILGWLMAASIVVFVGTLIAVPAVIVRIPADYFVHAKRPRSDWSDAHPVVRILLAIGKNALGIVFVLAGIAMLVLPGQGLLTLLIGFLMLDFPGKYSVERWLMTRPRVLQAMNWLRRRAGRAPLNVTGARAS